MNTNTTRTQRMIFALTLLAVVATALPAAAAEARVNVNQASVEQLALLPRVGPAIAQRIVEYREENGPFEQLEDLMLVRGIGEKTYDLIAPHAALSGETTLTEKVRSARPAGSADDGGEDESTPAS